MSSLLTRITRRSEREGNCLVWKGARTRDGYGHTYVQGKTKRVHRVAWELEHGPIPDGMLILHRCDNPACWAPEHLFLGTQADNVRDMHAKGRHYAAPKRSHCAAGHEFTPGNTRITKQGWQECRACKKVWNRRAYEKRRAA